MAEKLYSYADKQVMDEVGSGGGGGGGSGAEAKVVNFTQDGINASFSELKAALLSNKNVFISDDNNGHIEMYLLSGLYHDADEQPYLAFFVGASNLTFVSTNADEPMKHE